MTLATTAPQIPLALPAGAPAAARTLARLLRSLRQGVLDVTWPDGTQARYGAMPAAPGAPRATIRIADWRVCRATLASGDVGFAEAYIDGLWSTPDLLALLELLIANRDALETAIYGRWWARWALRLRHLFNRNSRRGSRRNIHAHYDLGNAFYRLWLDESLSYSSAWFAGRLDQPLAAAQQAKMRRALQACGLRPGARLLEIGCGWGALAEMASSEFGARVTGITLSTEQLAHARARMTARGLADRTDLRLQDYRDVSDGPYDAAVSIEMFEAVGYEYWDRFFAALRRQLRPGGLACLQTITIRDELFERYRHSTDFIQQYVFPGGLLPSPNAFRAAARRAGFEVVDALAFGADYGETLRRWREAFLAHEGEVRGLGFDARFLRLWDFYLAYCQAAFATGNTDVWQFTLRRT